MNHTSPLRFNIDDAQAAADAWGFNCGPAALCAVLGVTPAEIRPHLRDFESRRYVSPGMMRDILSHTRWISASPVYQDPGRVTYPKMGVVRVQWGGPWTKPGVPIRARYGKTHWIAVRGLASNLPVEAFDINAICDGGWLPWDEWTDQLVPWLLREAVPRADGTWWPTHCWEVDRA